MDMGNFRILSLLLMMAAFIGIVIWAWSRRRRSDFDEAARLPLEDDDRPAPPTRPGNDNARAERRE